MQSFLSNNREELIVRCRAKVAERHQRTASEGQLDNGIPMFLEQLRRTLQAEVDGKVGESLRISGASGGDASNVSEMGVTAAAHGKALLELGYSVDQVVHDYGDLCQAITDLAVERDAPFAVDQFRTLNRCLDNAIADAVSEFSAQRDATVGLQLAAQQSENLGVLAHELRNHLQTATYAYAALDHGRLSVNGATGALLKRSLVSLSTLLDQALGYVRPIAEIDDADHVYSLASFIADARVVASFDAHAKGCVLVAPEVDPLLGIAGHRDLLLAALVNLLKNAFKFTHGHTTVTLSAYASGERILIDVADHCGGLAPGLAERMFKPFTQGGHDRSGLGLGLTIARRSIEADGGTLVVRDLPGTGCVFTISLALRTLQ